MLSNTNNSYHVQAHTHRMLTQSSSTLQLLAAQKQQSLQHMQQSMQNSIKSMSRLDQSTKQQIRSQMKTQVIQFLQVQIEEGNLHQIQTEQEAQFFGDLIRWIKCIFRDCVTEDAKNDHESAEKDKTEAKEEKRKNDEEQQRKQKDKDDKDLKEQQEKERIQKEDIKSKEEEKKKENDKYLEEKKKYEEQAEQKKMQNEMKELKKQITINKKHIALLHQNQQQLVTKELKSEQQFKDTTKSLQQSKQSKAEELIKAEHKEPTQDQQPLVVKLSDMENQSIVNSVGKMVANQLAKSISLQQEMKDSQIDKQLQDNKKAEIKAKEVDKQAVEIANIVANKSINEVTKQSAEKAAIEAELASKEAAKQAAQKAAVEAETAQIEADKNLHLQLNSIKKKTEEYVLNKNIDDQTKSQLKLDLEAKLNHKYIDELTKNKLKDDLRKKLNIKHDEIGEVNMASSKLIGGQNDQDHSAVDKLVSKLATDDLKKEIKSQIELDKPIAAMQQRDDFDKTISSLLKPSKLTTDYGLGDLFLNTENSINLQKSVFNIDSKLKTAKIKSKKYMDAQNILSNIQQDNKINQKVEPKINASFYDSFSKKMTDFLGGKFEEEKLQAVDESIQNFKLKEALKNENPISQQNRQEKVLDQIKVKPDIEYPENISMMDTVHL